MCNSSSSSSSGGGGSGSMLPKILILNAVTAEIKEYDETTGMKVMMRHLGNFPHDDETRWCDDDDNYHGVDDDDYGGGGDDDDDDDINNVDAC